MTLLARVEALKGADREVDAELAFSYWPGFVRGRSNDADYAPRFTSSLDATVALVERVRPRAFITVDRYLVSDESAHDGQRWRAWVKVPKPDDQGLTEFFSGLRPTPALALLGALLKSLDASPAPLLHLPDDVAGQSA